MIRVRQLPYREIKSNSGIAHGQSDTFNFENLPRMAGWYGYVVGCLIRLTGTLKQTAATAALTKEVQRKLLKSVTIKYRGGIWTQNLKGRDLVNLNILEGAITSENVGGILGGDLPNDVNDHAIDQNYLVPFAPRWFASGRGNIQSLAGAIPIEALLNDGEITFTCCEKADLTADWEIKTGTTLTFRVYPLMAFASDPVLFLRGYVDMQSKGASELVYTVPGGERPRTAVVVAVADNDWGAFTLTSQPTITMDGFQYPTLVDEAMANKWFSICNLNDISDYADPCHPFFAPGVNNNLDGLPTFSEMKIRDGHQNHGDAQYLIHTLAQPTPDELNNDLMLQGVGPERRAQVIEDFSNARQPANRPNRLRYDRVQFHTVVRQDRYYQDLGAKVFFVDLGS